VALTLDLLYPRSTGLEGCSVEEYYYAKFQVVVISVLLYRQHTQMTNTRTYAHYLKLIFENLKSKDIFH